jgi:hypothetical protein
VQELELAPLTASSQPLALDRSIVLVRAPLEGVLEALAAFSHEAPVEATAALARGLGLDDALPRRSRERANRAVVYRCRGASEVGVIREGAAVRAHDVPLARRLSSVLHAPAVALHVAAAHVTYDLFHDGISLERILCTSGEVAWAESRFELDAVEVARDPYGRALALLQAYGLRDDRLVFGEFARGAGLIGRWDVTIDRCFAFAQLEPWVVKESA